MTEAGETIIGGLTYGGATLHIAINHALLIAALALLIRSSFGIGTGRRRQWLSLAIAMALIQVAVWFGVNAQGVSLIWSALFGYTFALLALQKRLVSALLGREAPFVAVALIGAIAAFLYYAIRFPVETTVAHSLAATIGAIWFAVTR